MEVDHRDGHEVGNKILMHTPQVCFRVSWDLVCEAIWVNPTHRGQYLVLVQARSDRCIPWMDYTIYIHIYYINYIYIIKIRGFEGQLSADKANSSSTSMSTLQRRFTVNSTCLGISISFRIPIYVNIIL